MLAGHSWYSGLLAIAGSLYGLFFAVTGTIAVIRGKYDHKRWSNIYAGLAWAFILVMAIAFFIRAGTMANRPYQGTWMMLFALMFLIVGVVVCVRNMIEQSTLKVQEDLLRLQIQIAEMNERLSKKEF